VKFPYIEERGRMVPIVPVRIKGNEWVTFGGYVDSGASYSVFRSDIAKILGIEKEDGKKEYVTVGDGSLITVYLHNLEVEFAEKRFEATIAFSKQLGIGFNIIGRKSFFEEFKFCFDDKNRVLEVF